MFLPQMVHFTFSICWAMRRPEIRIVNLNLPGFTLWSTWKEQPGPQGGNPWFHQAARGRLATGSIPSK